MELVNAGALEDGPTFLYAPSGDDTGTQYGPMFTCGGDGSYASELTVEPL